MRTHENNFIKRLQSGKEDALDYIVERYLPLIKSVVLHVLGPVRQEDLIGECVNDIFLAIWQNAKKFRGRNPEEFKNWICAVAKYKAIDCYRKEAKNPEAVADFLEIPVEVSTDVEDRVKELLSELDPMDQKIFTMRYLLGFSSEETAEKLGLSISAIDNRVYRGKKRLRQNGRYLYEGRI